MYFWCQKLQPAASRFEGNGQGSTSSARQEGLAAQHHLQHSSSCLAEKSVMFKANLTMGTLEERVLPLGLPPYRSKVTFMAQQLYRPLEVTQTDSCLLLCAYLSPF
eukprot:1161049-Pelagomonas_calceolata.AAC.11